MSDVLQQVQELPSYELIPVALLFACGLLLWAAGRRVMRVGLPAAGFLIGGMMAWSFGRQFDLGVAPWIAALSSGVIFAIAAALAYRLAIAVAVGLIIATFAPMAVWTADDRNLLTWLDPAVVQPAGDEPAVEQPALASPGPDAADAAGQPDDGTVPPGGEPAPPGSIGELIAGAGEGESESESESEPAAGDVERVDGFVVMESEAAEAEGAATDDGDSDVEQALRRPFEILAERLRQGWNEAVPGMRGLFVAAVFIGAMIGFVVGGLAPGFSATVVSALGGSFLLLATGSVLAARVDFTAESGLMRSPTFWTVTWVILAVIGLGIQSIFRPRTADKSAD